jgi:hypothetical protein
MRGRTDKKSGVKQGYDTSVARRVDNWVSVIDLDKRGPYPGLDFDERIDAMVRDFDEKQAAKLKKPRKSAKK